MVRLCTPQRLRARVARANSRIGLDKGAVFPRKRFSGCLGTNISILSNCPRARSSLPYATPLSTSLSSPADHMPKNGRPQPTTRAEALRGCFSLRISGHTQKTAKVSLDGSCRCICVEVLRRAVLERSPCSLLFGRTRPSMRPVGALPVCRANDPRSSSHVTGGGALQASDAVPFDEMAKRVFN